MKTTYIVQPFDEYKVKGQLILKPSTPIQLNSETDARRRADRLAEKHAGVVAVVQEYDEDTGEMGKTTILLQSGKVPDELFEQ